MVEPQKFILKRKLTLLCEKTFGCVKTLPKSSWILASHCVRSEFFFSSSEQFNWINLNKRSVMEGERNITETLFASFIFMPFTSHFRSNFDRFCHHFRFLFFTLEIATRVVLMKFPPSRSSRKRNLHKTLNERKLTAKKASTKTIQKRIWNGKKIWIDLN